MKRNLRVVKKTEKIVVLNSGGFDSVVLSHEVGFNNPNATIYSLFFNYGQLNCDSERTCSKKCADKLKHKWKEIVLPPFDWSDSVLSGGFNDSQYIPLRNLVFISYALSFARSIDAKSVYCAFINPLDEYFEDTSPMFLEKVNVLSDSFGIKVEAPFITYTKDELLKSLARAYGITRNDVYSCNYGNKPCGKCSDCESVDSIFSDIENHLADDILIDNRFSVNSDMVKAIRETKITSAKVYINNDCQFNCTHCFIGKSSIVSEPLSLEEWFDLFTQMKECGIKSVDFFGKEPLYNSSFYPMIKKCKELGMCVSLITNGVNIPTYIDQLEELKPEVTISVESFDKSPEHRTAGSFILKNLKLLVSKGIPVSVSIDLSKSNAGEIVNIIKKIHKVGVNLFYIKPIRPFGDNELSLMKELIPTDTVLNLVNDIIELSYKLNISVTMAFSTMDLYRMYRDNPTEFNKNLGYAIQNRLDIVDGVKFEFELYCHRYMNSVAITPDGFVLGCASEYCTDYSNYMSIRDHTLKECISSGKDSLSEENYLNLGCYFCKKYRKKQSKIFDVG